MKTKRSRIDFMVEYKAELKAKGEIFIAEIAVPILEKRGFFEDAENAKLVFKAKQNIVNQVERMCPDENPETGESIKFIHAKKTLDDGRTQHFKAPPQQLTWQQVWNEAEQVRKTGDTYLKRAREIIVDGCAGLAPSEAAKLRKQAKKSKFYQGLFDADWTSETG
jgi:hypothetical protein